LAFAKKYHRILKTVNSSTKEYIKEKIYVNAYDSRLKGWMKHFNGVATKYLESYLGWMCMLDREKNLTAERLLGIMAMRGMVCQPLEIFKIERLRYELVPKNQTTMQ